MDQEEKGHQEESGLYLKDSAYDIYSVLAEVKTNDPFLSDFVGT